MSVPVAGNRNRFRMLAMTQDFTKDGVRPPQ